MIAEGAGRGLYYVVLTVPSGLFIYLFSLKKSKYIDKYIVFVMQPLDSFFGVLNFIKKNQHFGIKYPASS